MRTNGLRSQRREQYPALIVRQGDEGRESVKRFATVGEAFAPAVPLCIGKYLGKGAVAGAVECLREQPQLGVGQALERWRLQVLESIHHVLQQSGMTLSMQAGSSTFSSLKPPTHRHIRPKTHPFSLGLGSWTHAMAKTEGGRTA